MCRAGKHIKSAGTCDLILFRKQLKIPAEGVRTAGNVEDLRNAAFQDLADQRFCKSAPGRIEKKYVILLFCRIIAGIPCLKTAAVLQGPLPGIVYGGSDGLLRKFHAERGELLYLCGGSKGKDACPADTHQRR